MSYPDIILPPLPHDGQEWFAKSVRDFNPVHQDNNLARKSIFGQVIVHGIHSAIRHLNALAEYGYLDSIEPRSSLAIKVNFRQPTYPQDEIRLETHIKTDLISCKSFVDELCISTINIKINEQLTPMVRHDKSKENAFHYNLKTMQHPIDLSFSEIENIQNLTISYPENVGEVLASRYPHIAAKMGTERLGKFGLLSSLVGMNLPGLYSLFVALECQFSDVHKFEGKLNDFSVTPVKFHSDFNYLKYAAQTHGTSATLEAIRRPSPVEQPNSEVVQSRLELFSQDLPNLLGKTAIIIGGSRGLGATCARILVSMGAQVTITYNKNQSSAIDISNDLGSAASTKKYDVLDPPEAESTNKFDHIYYFATPPIFVRKTKNFDPNLSHTFHRFYLDGFVKSDKVFSHANSSVFFPSSIEVESNDPGTIEYRISKQSGESVATSLQSKFPDKKYIIVRLPRLMTDQTATLSPGQNEDTIATLVDVIKQMAG